MSPDRHTLITMRRKPNLAVPFYLIHCWLYYVCDDAIISDATFDAIVAFLSEHWESIEHPHKCLLDHDMLKTGFHLQYPNIVKGAAQSLKELYGHHPKRRGAAQRAVPKVRLEG